MTKRPNVRQRLLDSAYAAMSDRGFEGSRIADIIEAADVGVGSFYNHFTGKEDLARAVFQQRVEVFGTELEQAVMTTTEIDLATCFVYRRLLERAEQDQAWAGFVLQLEPLFRMYDRLMRPHARVGLQIGIDDGTFEIDDLEAAISAVHGMMLAVTRAMLVGDLSSARAHRSSRLALRMFGVGEERAQALSRLSMSALHAAVGGKAP